MTGNVACCARAANGQATVAPLPSMKSRRLITSPEAEDRVFPNLILAHGN